MRFAILPCCYVKNAFLSAFLLSATGFGQTNTTVTVTIPGELRGKWIVERQLNTRTISCWGDRDAKKVLHTRIEYSPSAITWRKLRVNAERVTTKTVSAVQFQEENSSPSASGSQIDFQQLGIKADAVRQITIEHPPAQISRATTEFPGDDVLLKSSDTMIFSVCNVYFEAIRMGSAQK